MKTTQEKQLEREMNSQETPEGTIIIERKDEVKEAKREKIIDDMMTQKLFNETYEPKQSTATVPTHIPKSWYEQFVIYKDGATLRLYVYVDDTWSYTALT